MAEKLTEILDTPIETPVGFEGDNVEGLNEERIDADIGLYNTFTSVFLLSLATVTGKAGDFGILSDTSDDGKLKKFDLGDFITASGGSATGFASEGGPTTGQTVDMDIGFPNAKFVFMHYNLVSNAGSGISNTILGFVVFDTDTTGTFFGYGIEGTGTAPGTIILSTTNTQTVSIASTDSIAVNVTDNGADDHVDIILKSISRSGNNIRFTYDTTIGLSAFGTGAITIRNVVGIG